MSRETIKETAKDLNTIIKFDSYGFVDRNATAEALHANGYCKQSEGEWIVKKLTSTSKRGREINYSTHQCSVCGTWNGRYTNNFCPNCGAKMKGGAE